jgi:hypothetical protein
MDGPKLSAFRKLVNAHESLVYAAVKAAAIDDLLTKACSLPRSSRNTCTLNTFRTPSNSLTCVTALLTTFNGDPVSPSTHLALHAAVSR